MAAVPGAERCPLSEAVAGCSAFSHPQRRSQRAGIADSYGGCSPSGGLHTLNELAYA